MCCNTHLPPESPIHADPSPLQLHPSLQGPASSSAHCFYPSQVVTPTILLTIKPYWLSLKYGSPSEIILLVLQNMFAYFVLL